MKERIQLLVTVEINYEGKEERAFAVSQAKGNVLAVSNGFLCSPVKVKLVKDKKS